MNEERSKKTKKWSEPDWTTKHEERLEDLNIERRRTDTESKEQGLNTQVMSQVKPVKVGWEHNNGRKPSPHR